VRGQVPATDAVNLFLIQLQFGDGNMMRQIPNAI
jgi:hypothetical protein